MLQVCPLCSRFQASVLSPGAVCSPNAMQAVSVGTSDRIRSMWGRYYSWYTNADTPVNRMNQIRSSIWSRALSGT